MVANIRGYTPNYSFKLINFDTPRWHTLEYANWSQLDGMLLQSGVPSMRGAWLNNTLYLIGERVFDEETSAIYRCLVEHTSAISGTFTADRLANPTYWSLQLAGTPVYRGEWMPGVVYVLGDIVSVDDYTFYLTTTPTHLSSATFPPDAVNWQTIFDAAIVVADAEAAAASAFGHANAAAASAANALTSENNAETAETDAESWADDARAAQGAFRWAFSTGTAAVDPATGRIAFNNAIPASVTEIYISAQSGEAGNPDVSSWIVTWDDSTNPLTRGTLQLRKVGAPEEFMIFELTGNIVDNGTWLKLSVMYIAHSGSLANAEPLSVGFVRAGNVGPTGTGGGDMLRSNNLSDVVSVPTSRNNLGLGTAQIPTFAQVLLGNAPSAPMHATTKQYVDASPSLYISDTAPVGVQDGSLWWDSNRGTLLVRYNDGDSTQWVDAVAVPGLDTSQLATTAYVDAADDAIMAYAAPLDALAYSGMQINGSIEVAQEFGIGSGTTVPSGHGCDGWFLQMAGPTVTPLGAYALPQGVPGLNNVLALGVTTANPSLGAGDFVVVAQNIEGHRTARLGWGTAGAKPITICFWSAHYRTGTYTGVVRNADATRSYAFSYTQNVSRVAEFKTITIPGCTDGVWHQTNGAGLTLFFVAACGTTYTAPSLNTWLNSNYVAGPGQVNGVATTDDALYLTGIMVLPGIYAPTAAQSPLIMRPYNQELITCQRYFQKYDNLLINGYNVAVGSIYADISFTTEMRAAPSVTFNTILYSNASALALNIVYTNHLRTSIIVSSTAAAYANFGANLDARL